MHRLMNSDREPTTTIGQSDLVLLHGFICHLAHIAVLPAGRHIITAWTTVFAVSWILGAEEHCITFSSLTTTGTS